MKCTECGAEFAPEDYDEEICPGCQLAENPERDRILAAQNDEPEFPTCPICGGYMEWAYCWNGCDDGYFDEYETDPINFVEGEEVYPCTECHGKGGYWICANLPHSESETVVTMWGEFVVGGEG